MEIITMGKKELKKELFDHHIDVSEEIIKEMMYLNKPVGSLWGSTFTPNEKHCSDWVRWCDESTYRPADYGVIYSLHKNARIYTIDSQEDLGELVRRYPAFDDRELNVPGRRRKVYLNFGEISKDFDVIHLTDKGNIANHSYFNMAEVEIQGDKYSVFSLNSWDVETWLILNFDAVDLQSVRLYEKINESRSENEKEVLRNVVSELKAFARHYDTPMITSSSNGLGGDLNE